MIASSRELHLGVIVLAELQFEIRSRSSDYFSLWRISDSHRASPTLPVQQEKTCRTQP